MDFGIRARRRDRASDQRRLHDGDAGLHGAEQVVAGDIDARADLYAIGVVLFHLATAKLPFKGKTPFEMAQSRLYGVPTPIRELRRTRPSGWAVSSRSRSPAIPKAAITPRRCFMKRFAAASQSCRSTRRLPARCRLN
jgi:serine/threonine protein kinase